MLTGFTAKAENNATESRADQARLSVKRRKYKGVIPEEQ
jgi:hypothetical protein